MSILTTCAACAKALEHDAPTHCVNCQTRYCSDRCLRYHAHRGGHEDDCEEIANGGGAEQHHANKNYEEAVAVAVEECADDTSANNYAAGLIALRRFEEVKTLMRKTLPVARRVLSESNKLTLKIRSTYAEALYVDPAATHDDLREAVNTLEETTQTVRRVFGGAHAFTKAIEHQLQDARDALYARGLP